MMRLGYGIRGEELHMKLVHPVQLLEKELKEFLPNFIENLGGILYYMANGRPAVSSGTRLLGVADVPHWYHVT